MVRVPRQNRRREPESSRPLGGTATERAEWQGRDYLVRHVPGSSATKTYRCPGCDQEVRPGVPHVVVWPDEELSAENRRHWHTGCWAARDTRHLTARR